MKKIKTIIGLVAAGLVAISAPLAITAFTVAAPVALTGCGTFQGGGTNSQAQIDATALILQSTARVGALAAITPPSGSTNNAVYFNLAAETIGTFLTGKDYSPAAFQQALVDIKVPQANNIWVQIGIASVIDLYQIYYSQQVQGQVNGDPAAKAFLTAVQDGFNQALGKPVSLKLKAAQPVNSPILPRPLKR